jgi:hypothetical protein
MSDHAGQGAYFQYADVAPASTSDATESADDYAEWTSSEWGTARGSWVDRALLHARLREELRMEHRHLTDRQLDAIATMTVELRRVRVRLGSVSAMVQAATAAPR